MLASLLYSIVRLVVDLLSVRDREQAELQSEVLVLRHQLRVLQRQVRRPRWRPGDRLVLATIIERLPKRRWSVFLPSPETILRWHRELVRRKWAAFGRRPRQLRPAMDPEVVDLILRLAREKFRSIRSDDEAAFGAIAERYRRQIHVHCYRMLGS